MIKWNNPWVLPKTSSTQDFIVEKNGELLNTIVYTLDQQNGRGTHQKTWHADPGDWVFSFAFTHDAFKPGHLMMITSLSVIDGFKENITIKPPNDLIFGGKKCGGILIEQRPFNDRFITTIGIGVNLIKKEHSAYQHLPHAPSLEHLTTVFQETFNAYLTLPYDDVFKRYHSRIRWSDLRIKFQEKDVQLFTLNPDFSCETDHGVLPMAHLSFEIINATEK